MFCKTAIAFASALLWVSTAAPATVVHDTLGPTNTYSNSGGWFGHRSEFPDWQLDATAFVPTQSGLLDRITAGMHGGYPTPTGIRLSLRPDAEGAPSNGVLWQRDFPGADAEFRSVAVFPNLGGPWLEEGTRYWLVADSLDDQTMYTWGGAVVPGTDGVGILHSSRPTEWSVYPEVGRSLRVEVLVPEPGIAAILMAAIALHVRRRRSPSRL